MSTTTKNKKKLFIKEYINQKTHISKACKAANITRTTYYTWVGEDDEFVKHLEEAWEGFLDDVEEAIKKSAFGYVKETKEEKLTYQGEKIECIKESYYPPNTTSLKLIAEAKMRHRGYGKKQSEDKGDDGSGEEVGFTDEDL